MKNTRNCSFSALSGCLAQQGSLKYGSKATGTIRKVRGTMLKKIRKKLLAALTDKAEKQQPMTLLEKEFLRECGLTVDNGTKKQYNR